MVGVEFVLLRLEKFLTVCKRRKTLFYATDTKLVTRFVRGNRGDEGHLK